MTFNPAQPALLRKEAVAYSVVAPDVSAAYRARLAAALQDPDFRATPGFPIASDEAILALSDPPTYTACPNPFCRRCWRPGRRSAAVCAARLTCPVMTPATTATPSSAMSRKAGSLL